MSVKSKFGFISKAFLAAIFFYAFSVQKVEAGPSANINISTFYHALAPYGNWVNHVSYGRVWYPHSVPRNWRPYTEGYWAYTIENGWMWVSNWEWGWAPFHYGRWAWDDWYGWVWVPGRIWAPAWVFWRYGGGYASWAPMPPNYTWRPNAGFSSSYFDYDRYLNWDCWVSVNARDFSNRSIRNKILAPQQNIQILRVTNHIDNVTIINNNVVNVGIPVKQVERLTGESIKPIKPVILTESNGLKKQHRRGDNSNERVIFQPKDTTTSLEIIREEEERAKQISENINKDRGANVLTESPRKQHRLVPREPGRFSANSTSIKSRGLPDSVSELPLDDESIKQSPPLLNIPDSEPSYGNGYSSESIGQQQLESGKRLRQEKNREFPNDRQLEELKQPERDLDLQEMKKKSENENQIRVNERQHEERARQEEEQLRQQEINRQQQIELQQQQAEQERQMREQVRQQEERSRQEEEQLRQQEVNRQQQIELQQQQAEQEWQMREQMRQQEESARQQEEQLRQQELNRQQQMEIQRQAEQERQVKEQVRQQEELARQQEEQLRQQETIRQQEMELQQVEQDRQIREEIRRQDEQIRRQQIERQEQIQQLPDKIQPQNEQSERGRGSRSSARGERFR